ncbi:MAG: filamentous hemagglutinin N-terminal domain-containing protein, partial [Pseudomonadales bacterium]
MVLIKINEMLQTRGKSPWVPYQRAFVTFVSTAFLLNTTAHALPQNGSVAAGDAALNYSQNQLDVQQNSAKVIVNWDSFDIQANETVNFNQPSSSSVILNRVQGSNASEIFGKMNANGQVFLVNPHGVTFAPGAQVNVGALVASTLDIKDNDFLNGNYQFEAGSGLGTIANSGQINANTIALLGNQVTNDGWLIASTDASNRANVAMVAGDKIKLSFGGDGLLAVDVEAGTYNGLVENRQLIRADGGQVLLRAEAADALLGAAVNNSGVIQAQGIAERDGKIVLLADMEHGTTTADGTLDASSSTGDGGFIDTSAAHVKVKGSAKVTAASDHGENGLWLIDPNDLIIDSSNITAYNTSLAGGTNVELNTVTNGSAGGNGDIFVNAAFSWSAANTILTLKAENNIHINATITASGSGSGVHLNTGLSHNTGAGDWSKTFDDNALDTGTATTFTDAERMLSERIKYADDATITLSGNNAIYREDNIDYAVVNGKNSNIAGSNVKTEFANMGLGLDSYVLGVDLNFGNTAYTSPDGATGNPGRVRFDG